MTTDDRQRSPADLRQMAELFDRLSGGLGGAALEAHTVAAVIDLAEAAVPGVESATVTLLRRGRFDTLGGDDPWSKAADLLQYELESGPCVDALLEDTSFHTGGIASDDRWPVFGREAHSRYGVTSMMAFRLNMGEARTIGCLNLYSRSPDAFDNHALVLGLLVATHAALALTATFNAAVVRELRADLESNRVIGMAVGVIMARHLLTREQAFDLLRIAAQEQNLAVWEVATQVVDTGTLVLRTIDNPRKAVEHKTTHPDGSSR